MNGNRTIMVDAAVRIAVAMHRQVSVKASQIHPYVCPGVKDSSVGKGVCG